MTDNSKKLGLNSISILFLGILMFIGFDMLFNQESVDNVDNIEKVSSVAEEGAQVKQKVKKSAYNELLGRWQSACNHRHFGRPVIMGIDFRPNYIRWSNQFFLDKKCNLSDEIERQEYFIHYVEDVRILGDIWAKLFRFEYVPSRELEGSEHNIHVRQEIFHVKDGWLYISVEGSGPDYDKPWDLDSNLGLRQVD